MVNNVSFTNLMHMAASVRETRGVYNTVFIIYLFIYFTTILLQAVA